MESGGEFLVWAAGDFENFMAKRPIQDEDIECWLEATVRLLVANRWPLWIHTTYDESIEYELTVVGGRMGHRTGGYAKLAPELPPVSPEWSPVAWFGGHWSEARPTVAERCDTNRRHG